MHCDWDAKHSTPPQTQYWRKSKKLGKSPFCDALDVATEEEGRRRAWLAEIERLAVEAAAGKERRRVLLPAWEPSFRGTYVHTPSQLSAANSLVVTSGVVLYPRWRAVTSGGMVAAS